MSRLPPGPKYLKPMEFLRATFSAPGPVFQRTAAKYGDPFRVTTTHSGPLTVTGDPEGLRAIYTADPDTFDAWGADISAPVFGSTSLVSSSGARHKRDRKLLTPPFNASSMRAYGPTIAEMSREAALKWPFGRPFSMLETTQEIALDVIVRVVFGVEGEARIHRTREAVLRLIDSVNPFIIAFMFLRHEFGGIGPWARNRRAVRALDDLLTEEIRARRETCESRNDILSLMMRARYDDGSVMSDVELIDQLRTLLFAGHETTAVALAWTLYSIHRDPEVLSKLLGEIDALGPSPDPDTLASLPYLEAACLEGLRLHPPVVDVARRPRRPFDLLGYTVPAGEGLVPSPLLLHMREDLYPEPERFRPSRFLERKFSPFEYNPFGGGARRCLGAAFALYEMKVIIGTWLSACRLRLADGREPLHIRRGLTLGPSGGVPMIFAGTRAARPAVKAA